MDVRFWTVLVTTAMTEIRAQSGQSLDTSMRSNLIQFDAWGLRAAETSKVPVAFQAEALW